MLWWMPKAPRKNQIVASRSPQSASCQSDDRPRVARRRLEDRERLGDAGPEAVPEMVKEPRAAGHDRHEGDHRAGMDDAVLEDPRVVEGRQRREGVQRRQHALRQRPHEHDERERHVDEREDDRRRDDRRVRAAGDRTMGEEDPHDVAAACGEDRVDADARDVGGEDRAPGHARVRVRGREDVPPRTARAAELQEMAADRGEEREDRDLREELPEALARSPDLVDHALTVLASLAGGCGAIGTGPARFPLDGKRCLTPTGRPRASRGQGSAGRARPMGRSESRDRRSDAGSGLWSDRHRIGTWLPLTGSGVRHRSARGAPRGLRRALTRRAGGRGSGSPSAGRASP